MKLREQLQLALNDAETAYKAGDITRGDEKRTEAERLAKALEGLSNLTKLQAGIPEPEPMRPVLPGAGDGTTPAAQPQPEQAAIKAAYIQRFGEPDSYVKAVLTDLHGPDYEALYWSHKALFNRYLRVGDGGFSGDERNLLRSVILTPVAVKAAFAQGMDDVRALKTTMVEASDTLGGYIVPVDFQARVIERLAGYTVVRPRATKITTSRDRVEFPKATGGTAGQYSSNIRVTWVNEVPTAGAAATNLTWGLEEIPIYTVMAEAFISRNMLEDAAFNLEPYLGDKFAEASGIDEDNRFLTGDGANGPEGILPDSANGLSLSYGYNDVSTTAIEWDGLINTAYAIDSVYRQRAVWIGEKATYKAIRKLTDGEGRYLWKQDQQAGQPMRLEGFEVLEQEAMPSIATNAFPMIFGDLAGYFIADRVGMSIERYLDSAVARINSVCFLMRRRLGGKVVEPWRFVLYKVATS